MLFVFSNFIPQYFFISILVFIIFIFFFWILFVDLFFNFTPHYFFDWELDFMIFFGFDFYGSIRSHDPCHEFKRLNHIGFSFFKFFLNLIFFQFQLSILCWLGICNRYFFTFLSMDLSRPHVLGHEFSEFIKVDSGFFYIAFFLFFLILHLQHLIHLIMKLHDFIRFVFLRVILVSQLDHGYGLMA
jgi:hypothetical protein